MRWSEIKEDGRIVKGVNTTADVGTDEIKTQAAKFGNSVDKDGRPPTLSKRVKGKSTNVLFNLGLSESRVRQLEASYEGNIGIMELMKFFQIAPKELVAQVKQLISQKKDKEVWKIVQQYTGTKLKGKEFETDEDQHPNEKPVGPETKPTMPKGTIRVKVSDVYDWYKLGQHISDLEGLGKHDFGKGPPEAVIAFGSEEEEHKYIKLLQQLGLEILDVDPGAADAPGVETDPTYNTENFADGKVKGKSRPGRVKKSGASCNGSVTALRKRAKNASGEKAKMYHWCANMKAGKK